MKEAVTKVIDMLTQEHFHRAFQKLLERYNKYIAAKDISSKGTSFICVLSIKVPIRRKSGNLSYAPRISLRGRYCNNEKKKKKIEFFFLVD